MNWTCNKFDDLSPAELYAIIRLRNEVFVIEQHCIYQDADDKDQHSWHFCGWNGDDLVAYTRLLPPGIAFEEASIGRVVTSPRYRKTGAGRKLMELSTDKAFDLFNTTKLRIGAQLYLLKFYESLGYQEASETYLEDGIPHIEMIICK